MEIWKDIEGYEGSYQVSNYGRVKSLARDVECRGSIRHQPECLLKVTPNSRSGYLYIQLWKNGKMKLYSVHRLVAIAFIENPYNLPEVNHKDENKANNNVGNLEWCTREYNHNYGTRNQRVAEAHKGVSNIKRSIPVVMLSKQDVFIRQFTSSQEAIQWLRANGLPKAARSAISMCCNGKLKSAYGYKWNFCKN